MPKKLHRIQNGAGNAAVDSFERIFKLHRRLSGRRVGLTFAELQEELACSRSTLRRTLTYLRDVLQAPLEHDPAAGGYLYAPGSHYELPGLWFNAQELSALLLIQDLIEQQPIGPLREALQPMRARIERLATQAGLNAVDWRRRLRLQQSAARPTGPAFDIVAEAVIRRRRLQIHYHARSDDRMAPRTVSPQRLMRYRDNWYLDAWCHRREALRVFALERIIAAEALDEAAIEVDPVTVEQALGASYGIFAGTPTAIATVRFTPFAARWVRSETWHPDQQDQETDDGGLIRQIPYHQADELLMDLLRHGPEVEVLAPPELRAQMVERLEKALRVYRDGNVADSSVAQGDRADE